MNLHGRIQADDHLDQALLALEAQVPALAKADLEQAIRLQPDQLQTRLAQAQTHLADDQPQQAMTALDALTQCHPDQARLPHLRLLQSRALASQGQLDLADRHLKGLAQDYPDDVRAHRLLAVLAMRMGQAEAAITHLRQLLRLSPSDQTGRRALTRLLAEHQPQAGLDLLRQDQDTDPSINLLQQARLYRRLGRWREAEDIFARLIKQHADDGSLMMEAGELAQQMGRQELALQRFEIAAQRPGHQQSGARQALVHLYLQAGQWAKAVRLCREMLRQNRDEVYAWIGLQVCGLALNRPRFVRYANRYLDHHSSPHERRLYLARLWKSASLGLTLAHIYKPVSARHRSPLRNLLQGALQTLTQQQVHHPQRADLHYHLANCQNALGHPEQASFLLHKALAINPHYVAARRLLKRIDHEHRKAA